MNAVVFYDRGLSSLWYILIRMGINLIMVCLKYVFRMFTYLLRTTHDLKKKKKKCSSPLENPSETAPSPLGMMLSKLVTL